MKTRRSYLYCRHEWGFMYGFILGALAGAVAMVLILWLYGHIR